MNENNFQETTSETGLFVHYIYHAFLWTVFADRNK